jgi:hypothetical protein
MPTTYQANPAGIQAPDTAPEPDKLIEVELPADGDPPNASTWEQVLKGLADHVGWLFQPRAKASAWTQPIMKWLSAGLHKRFMIDHLGYPQGRFVHIREDFCDAFVGTVAGDAAFGVLPGWRYQITGANGVCNINNPSAGSTRLRSRVVLMVAGDTIGNFTKVMRYPGTMFTDDSSMAVEFDVNLVDAAATGVTHRFGWMPSAAAAYGCYLEKNPSNGNWEAVTADNGVKTVVDTAVPAVDNTFIRCRIEYHGANADDATTARALYFINGNLVANITTNLPPVDLHLAAIHFTTECIAATTGTRTIYVGAPVTYSHNTWLNAA